MNNIIQMSMKSIGTRKLNRKNYKLKSLLLVALSIHLASCVPNENFEEDKAENMFSPIMSLVNISPPLSKDKVEEIIAMDFEIVHTEPFNFYKKSNENLNSDFLYAEFRQPTRDNPLKGGVIIVKVNTKKHRISGDMVKKKFGSGEYAPPPRGQLADRMYSLRYPHNSEGGIVSFDFLEDDAEDLLREIVVNLPRKD